MVKYHNYFFVENIVIAMAVSSVFVIISLFLPLSHGTLDWDVELDPLPRVVDQLAQNLDVIVGNVTVQGIPVRYRYAAVPENVILSSGQSLLLLHGAAFSSKTWASDKMKTLQYLAAMGHDAFAIDLPGYGDTPRRSVRDRTAFLVEVMEILGLRLPVVVSPSMSGRWSLPLITERPDTVGGYVPVAPVDTRQYVEKLKGLTKIPTMIVYGEYDTGAKQYSTEHLKNIPNHVVVVLKESRHPAYLDQPEKWNQILYNFMKYLKGF